MLPSNLIWVFPFSRNWQNRVGLFAEFLDHFLERLLGRALRKLPIVLITMKCWHLFPLESPKQKLDMYCNRAKKEEVPFYCFPEMLFCWSCFFSLQATSCALLSWRCKVRTSRCCGLVTRLCLDIWSSPLAHTHTQCVCCHAYPAPDIHCQEISLCDTVSHQRERRKECRGNQRRWCWWALQHRCMGCSTCPAGTAKAPLAVTPLTLYLLHTVSTHWNGLWAVRYKVFALLSKMPFDLSHICC